MLKYSLGDNIHMAKENLLVIFGGQSSEHAISILSAKNIMANIDQTKYNLYQLFITKDGTWLYLEHPIDTIDFSEINEKNIESSPFIQRAVLSPDASQKALLIMNRGAVHQVHIDIVFPVLHGKYGEDGSIQGLFTLARIPYVGCDVLSSAIAMDKLSTKIVVDQLDIRQATFVPLFSYNYSYERAKEKIESKLTYPVFIKPSNAGSSIGVSKVHDENELKSALEYAFKHDKKVLVEEFIEGREIECSILGNHAPKASGIGEILSAEEFYDFEAKYSDIGSKTVVSPDLPEGIKEKIQDSATRIFSALGGKGLSRVDFFLTNENEVVFNEINTMPGFTAISMYQMLWLEQGMTSAELIEELLALAKDACCD